MSIFRAGARVKDPAGNPPKTPREIPGNPEKTHEQWRFEESHSGRLGRCPRCWSTSRYRAPGKGPHHAALRCAMCDRFIKWLPKPRPPKGGR